MSAPAVNIQGVRKSFGGSFTLGPLTLEVPRGTICALVGPNGAGKTTLLNLLMGLTRADDGRVTLLDRGVRNEDTEIKRRTAFVSPDLSYRAWGSVGRAIDFVSGFYADWNRERCERLQLLFDIHRGERIDALSFGARMKLALVLALSRDDAELLLLDEPTAGLDPVARQMLFTELLHFMQHEERTIVIASHQLADLERFADRVAIMNSGRLVTCGSIPELLERYVQIDAQLPPAPVLPRTGLQLLARDGDRARLLVDRSIISPDELTRLGVETIGKTALTLEELFVALIMGGGRLQRWLPRTAAA
jgi:ABC-2 type transport system ATP-binding protein